MKDGIDTEVIINWYPGHMAKAHRAMEEQLKLVDIIIELKDARMPLASSNPKLSSMAPGKKRLVILNKTDKADDKQNQLWKAYFEKEYACLLVNSVHDNLSKDVVNCVKVILKDKLEKAKARGIRKKVLRAMVVGVPNVGKSTFINNIVKKKVAKAENRPGVTRSLQWIRINEDLELLDTPGVLWPKISDQRQAKIMALLGSINDEVVDRRSLVEFAFDYLLAVYPGVIAKRYEIEEVREGLLEAIAKKKGCLLKDGTIDFNKAVDLVLKDIRSDALGRISWEIIDDAGESLRETVLV